MNIKNILILFGHTVNTGSDRGAMSGSLIEGIMNKVCGVAMADYLRAKTDLNITIDTDNTKVEDEVKMVNKGNYDLVISIHFNAGGGDGFECYYYSKDKTALSICKAVEKEVTSIGQNSRGCKIGDKYIIINDVAPTSLIFEGGFIDNKIDRKLFESEEGQRALGVAYAKGVIKALGIKEKEDKTDYKKEYDKLKKILKDINTLSRI